MKQACLKRPKCERDELVEERLASPKKRIKMTDKTIKAWSKEGNTLPEDLRYSGEDFVCLKMCSGVEVEGTTAAMGWSWPHDN